MRSIRRAMVLPLLLCGAAAHSQACWDKVRTQLETPMGVSTVDVGSLDNEAKKCLHEVLSDPATLNRALNLLTASDSGWAFLRDVHFAFKTFEAPDPGGTTQAHLGFSYDYNKAIVTSPLGQACGPACVNALNLRFSTQGNVAFESDVNPRDFLESHLSFAWFRSSGGAKQLSPQAQDHYNALAIKMAMVPAGREAELQQYTRQLSRLIAGNLTNQLYLEAGADISFESDQSFDRKQWVYAARAAIDFRGWAGLDAQSWQTTPTSGRLNIFDYPFALIRRLTGYGPCDSTSNSGSCFAPLATSWPTASIAIGQVKPSDSDPRKLLPGENGDYTRVAIELSFKTPVAKTGEQPIYVTANYRRYEELSPSTAVKDADLASFSYLSAVLGPQRGVFASYSTGRLPFDRRNDQVYELGFRTALN
jgi:hypothetical protein